MTAPERHRTLAEVCELYFPGVSPCALRWMIKRRGYAHSRWGREYRLTDSQVAAIQAELATPARQDLRHKTPTAATVGRNSGSASEQSSKPDWPRDGTRVPAHSHRELAPQADAKRALAERLSAPPSVNLADTAPWHQRERMPPEITESE